MNNGAAVGPQGEGRESPSSFPKYPAYKDSGVEWLGVVPEHWGVSPLKWLVEQVTDKATTSDFQVGLENIEGWTGRFIETDTEFAGDGIAFRQEDILFGKLRPYLAKVWLAGRSGQAVGDFFVLRPRTVNSEFLHKYILTPTVIEDLNASTIGAKMPRVGWEDMAALAVTLPPHKEQTQIARFLDHETARIDALIEEQQRLIELLKEKRQAVISHAVTKGLDPTVPMKDSGVEWLGEVPAHWDCGALARVADRVVVGIAEAATHAYVNEGVPILRATNIRAGKIIGGLLYINDEFADGLGSKLMRAGDLVTVRTGNAGVTAVVPEELDGCQCFTMLITTLNKNSNSEYFCLLLNSHYAKTYFSLEGWGTAQINISVPILKWLPVPIPPLFEQKEISVYLHSEIFKIDELIDRASEISGLLSERRSVLISAAVTGKIDVRGWQQPASAPSPELIKEAV